MTNFILKMVIFLLFGGDSEVDVETAQNANVQFIAVGWGFRSQ